ncbi:hypothetical protein [Aeromicrobium sp. 9AM]|uniref:hypothetical protein n=1 Tax=Aeromicrobium sp. 9AM TaxID=2653126 RepID=UPI0012F341D1|nr:hypothetical protein [Aeromicrobium sp. 9AM]VXB58263.1 conserved hypothetical protein [Aeromicrobium sp. 9AM]
MGWTIRHRGTAYEIDTGDGPRVSVLLADGIAVDEQTADYWEASTLTHDDTTFEVRWGPRNTITSCALVETDEKGEPAKTPMVPPPGSKAARQEAFQREHPTAYVVRRTAWAGFEILIGLLGISALLGGLLPRLDLSWLPRPGLPDWLPELSKPEWLRYLDVTYWLGRLGLSWPDIGIPGWAEAVLEQKKYWLPLVVAVTVALGQLERRRKIDADRAERERPSTDDEQP